VLRSRRHPGNDALVRWYMAEHGFEALAATDEAVVRHVSDCTHCTVRYETLCSGLADLAAVAVEDADAAFSAEDLRMQRERILRRIDTQGARVLAFPAPEPVSRHASSTRPLLRWVAVAAAAGLFVGLVAGRILHLSESPAPANQVRASAVTRPMAPKPPAQGTRAVTLTTAAGEDAFLSDVDSAITDPRTPALEAIDTMTLRAAEIPPFR
jgi:hypothetical protein